LFFTDHNEELGRLIAAGRAKEFSAFRWQGSVPDPQAPDTFERSKLNWSELTKPPHAELFEWYRQLIALRRRKAAGTKTSVNLDAAAEWLTLHHAGVLAVFNFSERAQSVPRPHGDWQLYLRSDSAGPTTSTAAQALESVVPKMTTLVYAAADG
jgi:maltooligosyltrehalose trehalohydrolase